MVIWNILSCTYEWKVLINLSTTYKWEGENKMSVKYVNVSIHEDLAEKIDKFIKESKEGYRSRAELISEAVRLRLGIAKLKQKK